VTGNNLQRRQVDRKQVGLAAEDAAARYLAAAGLTITLRNYRCRMGELDLIARAADGTLVIAEVRLRSSRAYGGAAASVTHTKQRRIGRASRHLLARYPALASCPIRFDVLEVQPASAGFDVRWIQHAFVV
jgi:putative endonuclease